MIKNFITHNGLPGILLDGESNKQPTMRLGFTQDNPSAADQWKGKIKPPSPLRDAGEKFRKDLKEYFASKKAAEEKLAPKKTAPGTTADSSPQDNTTNLSPSPPSPPPHQNLKEFLSTILSSPEMIDDPSFFKQDISTAMLASMFIDTCDKTSELERNKKENDDKKQKAVGAAVDVREFTEDIDAYQFPTLVSKNICIKTDKDITPVLREIVKLAKTVEKSTDLLKRCSTTTT